ncbi:MAG: U32 family peptidase [Eubacteriaceae bacterium]|jgi:putative protease|nr:U32 family peptidase [Eubacteriaceae bacterium]
MKKKPELLAPAGNFEKLKYALHFGADAVYCAGERYGLRAQSDNFNMETLKEAVTYTHDRGKKIYITVNMLPRNEDFIGLPEYLSQINALGIDGIIVADPGVFMVAKETVPNLKISMSTQTNNLNSQSVLFWYKQGARRMVLARELSYREISEIMANKPQDMEIEIFVHGAMCIAYSGRCLLSHYMTGRDANRGDCAQSCRWKYHLMEEQRPEEYFPIEEDGEGAFVFNSKDLCLIRQIPTLMATGIDSFKIEGRMKSLYYVSTVVSVYRQVIDRCNEDPNFIEVPESYVEELQKTSHRHFTEGFFHGTLGESSQNYESSSYQRSYDFAGIVLDYDVQNKMALVEQRNKISLGDTIEILSASHQHGSYRQIVTFMKDEEGNTLQEVPHPQMHFYIKMEIPVRKMDILRKPRHK